MVAVTDDPSLNSVSHEFEIDKGLAYLVCLANFLEAHFGHLRGRGHSMILFGDRTFLALGGLKACLHSRSILRKLARAGSPNKPVVYGVNSEDERILFETIRMLPFHFRVSTTSSEKGIPACREPWCKLQACVPPLRGQSNPQHCK